MASWRDDFEVHPAADLFPPMSPDELRALGKDIREHGLTSSVAFWCDGKSPAVLVDGRSRLDAIEIEIGPVMIGPPSLTAGKDFMALNKVIVLDKSVDPWAYVISANILRRHLDAEGKRKAIADLIKANPEKSNRQIAATVKASHPTVAKVRDELEKKGDVEKVSTSIDSKGRKQPAKKERRTEDDFRRDVQAKAKAGSMVPTAPPPVTTGTMVNITTATAMPDDIRPMLPAEQPAVDAVAANPITAVWDNASDKQRQRFVKLRRVEIAIAEAAALAFEDADDLNGRRGS